MGSTILEPTFLETTAARLAALGDPLRLRIVNELAAGEQCVCRLQDALGGVALNLLSYHLRVLRESGCVEARRRGRWVDYRLVVGALEEIRRVLDLERTGSGSQSRRDC